jgi:cysteine desulfurase/selenocysteine lyase
MPHCDVNVTDLDVDFYVFSSHKAYGPNGVGVVYGRKVFLDALPPYQGGGDMIRHVSFFGTTFADPPTRFEAGTPNISGVIGMGVALAYLRNLKNDARIHEQHVLNDAKTRLQKLPYVTLVGASENQVGSISFVIEGVHPHDVGTLMDQKGIAVRVGHHCAQPLMDHFGVPATIRVSFGVYSTCDDVDRLCEAIRATVEFFKI